MKRIRGGGVTYSRCKEKKKGVITVRKTVLLKSFITVDFNPLFMPMIVVCKDPADYPGKFVARLFRLGKPTVIAVVKDTLPEIRMTIPRNMVRLPRHKTDDPVILETWI